MKKNEKKTKKGYESIYKMTLDYINIGLYIYKCMYVCMYKIPNWMIKYY